jgi:L-ribulose-5-phosphate 3-epimerase
LKNNIGVMQGRLLPKYKGRYQAHPIGYWQDEFYIAKEIGLDCIEFILDFNQVESNPLLKKNGISEIQSIVNETGVKVKSICADYLMEAPLHSKNILLAKASKDILVQLLQNSIELGVSDIIIPCIESCSLAGKEVKDQFIKMLHPVIEVAKNNNINLSLETDLPPKSFLTLLERLDSSFVTVNYDIGNSAALGYDPIEELNSYGDRITDIHIKDRLFGGGSILLGQGNADFDVFFNKLVEFDYQGPFIMQAYRDEEGIEIFKKQLSWVMPYLSE